MHPDQPLEDLAAELEPDGILAPEAYFGRYQPAVVICLVGPLAILGYLLTVDVGLMLIIAAFAVFVPLAPRVWDRVTAEKVAGLRGARQ